MNIEDGMCIFAEYPVHQHGIVAPVEAKTKEEAVNKAKLKNLTMKIAEYNGEQGYKDQFGRFYLLFTPEQFSEFLERTGMGDPDIAKKLKSQN